MGILVVITQSKAVSETDGLLAVATSPSEFEGVVVWVLPAKL